MNIFLFLKSKTFFKHIGLAFIAILAIIFLLQYWLSAVTNHDQKIQVPNLNRMIIKEVERTLNELDLTYTIIDSSRYNPNYPKKSVMEQSPQSGDFVKEKRKIYLTINSSNYRNVSVPDVLGKTKRLAIADLESQGFIVGTNFTYVYDIGKDVVRGMRHDGKILLPKQKLPQNSIIELVLGNNNK